MICHFFIDNSREVTNILKDNVSLLENKRGKVGMNETGKAKNNVFCTKIPIRLHYGLLWLTGFIDAAKLHKMRLVVLPLV